MSLFLVYLEWGEVAMGGGESHVGLAFTVETEEQEFWDRNWRGGTNLPTHVDNYPKPSVFSSHCDSGQALFGEGKILLVMAQNQVG